jgi:opacity protein-like surface antigen
MMRLKVALLCYLTLASSGAYALSQADDYTATPRLEIIAAGTTSQVTANNSHLNVTSSETDTLIQTNNNKWNNGGAQLGIGYNYPLFGSLLYSDKIQWFTAIEPELNFYYANIKNTGDVYRFDSSAFNDLTYNMNINSKRLMIDAGLTVASWRSFSVYALGGMGKAWNRIDYNDNTNADDPCPEQRINLNSHTSGDFAWEAGTGVKYTINNRVGVSFAYLYTDFGTQKTDNTGNSGTITAPTLSSNSIPFHTQSLLLGLHIAL